VSGGPAEHDQDDRAAEVVMPAARFEPSHLLQVGAQRATAFGQRGRLEHREAYAGTDSQASQARPERPVVH
jgi:hypothetical protein